MAEWYDEVYEGTRYSLEVSRVVHAEESEFQKIEVLETPAYGRVLCIDGVFMTSERDEFFYHEMLVHPALVTAPRIERVLVIGGGPAGIGAAVASADNREADFGSAGPAPD